jgi:hypothetical protein
VFDSLWASCIRKDVTKITTAIRFRLSAAQISVIWPGLDLLFKSYAARQHKGGIRYEYPFRVYPPPGGFDRGKFDQNVMDEILDLWKRLRPKAKAGGRVQMDPIELRAAIFAIRANIDFVRKRRHDLRRLDHATKAKFMIDDESFDQLKIRSQRVIGSLERHMKRANRVLLKLVTREQYTALMNAWKAHLRWMQLHIAYFRPLPKIIRGRRIRQQREIDELMEMAVRGLQKEGYVPPDLKELRRMVRLYVRSARRGREGDCTPRFLLDGSRGVSYCWYLAKFILRRLDLKELP